MRRLWMRLALPLIGAAFSAVLGFAPAFTQAAFADGSNPSDGYMYSSGSSSPSDGYMYSSGGSNSCDGYMYGSPCMGYQLPYSYQYSQPPAQSKQYNYHSHQPPAKSKQYNYHSYQPPAKSKQYNYHSYQPHKSYDQDDHSYNSHGYGYGGYGSSGSQMGGYGGYGSSGSSGYGSSGTQMGGYGSSGSSGYGSSGTQMGGYGSSGSSGYGSSGSQMDGYGGSGQSMTPQSNGYGSQAPQGGNPYAAPANPPMSSQEPPAAPSPAPMPAPGAQTVTVNLVAHNLAFNMSTITVPAGAMVVVNFNNQDAGVPHNFAVYTDSSAQQAIFRGQIITGPAMATYTFTAPSQPGAYFFRCDVHFTMMTGQFVVQ